MRACVYIYVSRMKAKCGLITCRASSPQMSEEIKLPADWSKGNLAVEWDLLLTAEFSLAAYTRFPFLLLILFTIFMVLLPVLVVLFLILFPSLASSNIRLLFRISSFFLEFIHFTWSLSSNSILRLWFPTLIICRHDSVLSSPWLIVLA